MKPVSSCLTVFQLVTVDCMALVVSLFVSVMRTIQCHVTLWMEAATVIRDGLGKSVHYVSTLSTGCSNGCVFKCHVTAALSERWFAVVSSYFCWRVHTFRPALLKSWAHITGYQWYAMWHAILLQDAQLENWFIPPFPSWLVLVAQLLCELVSVFIVETSFMDK